jgi:hypothetical protein
VHAWPSVECPDAPGRLGLFEYLRPDGPDLPPTVFPSPRVVEEFGIWHLAFGIWHLEFGIWKLEVGSWNFTSTRRHVGSHENNPQESRTFDKMEAY